MKKIFKIIIIFLIISILPFFIPFNEAFCYPPETIGFSVIPHPITCEISFSHFVHSDFFIWYFIPMFTITVSILFTRYRKQIFKINWSYKKSMFYFVLITVSVLFSLILFTPFENTLRVSQHNNSNYSSYALHKDSKLSTDIINEIHLNMFYGDLNFNCIEEPLTIEQICNSLDYYGTLNYEINHSLFFDLIGIKPTIHKSGEYRFENFPILDKNKQIRLCEGYLANCDVIPLIDKGKMRYPTRN